MSRSDRARPGDSAAPSLRGATPAPADGPRDDPPRLILFDIDGTLLRTQGAGMRAMIDALRELHPQRSFSFDGIEIAGRLDTLIWHDLAARHEIDPGEASHARFRAAYARHLERHLAETPERTLVMPGIPALLDALRSDGAFHLGLVTGNYSETGRLKIRSGGIDADLFLSNAWGDDGPSRRHLPHVAMRRFRDRTGLEPDPARTVIIGDTPHDVDCALAAGCRVIAVATGDFPLDELASHGAHLAVESLAETAAIVAWLRGDVTP